MNLAKISTNGQITIPVEVRRQLKLTSGDKIIFLNNKEGEVVMKNINVSMLTKSLNAHAEKPTG